MYENHYQVLEDPFRLMPDQHTPYEHRSYLSGKAFLQHIVTDSDKTIIVVTGLAGSGKTTLVNNILQGRKESSLHCMLIHASKVNAVGLYNSVASDLNLGNNISEKEAITRISNALADNSKQSRCTALVIDNAHELGTRAFEMLGSLAKLIHDQHYYAKIFLVGNDKLAELLRPEGPDTPYSRVITGWELMGMDVDEVQGYVNHRLSSVGGSGGLKFEDDAWEAIFRFSDGIPRRINRICGRLMINGLIENKLEFDADDVVEAVRHLDNEGLLEINAGLAKQYGLMGSTRSIESSQDTINMSAFVSGYRAEEAPSEEVDTISSSAFEQADESASNPTESGAQADESIEASLQGALKGTGNSYTDIELINDDVIPDELDEESLWKPGKVVVLLVLLIISAGLVVYYGILGDDPLDTVLSSSKSTGQVQIDEQKQAPVTSTIDTAQKSQLGREQSKKGEPEKSAQINERRPLAKPDVPVEQQGNNVDTADPTKLNTTGSGDLAGDEQTVDDKLTENKALAKAQEQQKTIVEKQKGEAIDVSKPSEKTQETIETVGSGIQKTAQKPKPIVAKKPVPARTKPTEVSPEYTIEQLKSMLLGGLWFREEQPAILLPSELNKCTDNGKDIFCLSEYDMSTASTVPVDGHTGAMLADFTTEGTFNILYRSRANTAAKGDARKAQALSAIEEQRMTCRFFGQSIVRCIQDGFLLNYQRRYLRVK